MRLFSFAMKKLRSGYTTGACAAAAAKGAVVLLLTGKQVEHVTIPFPDESRVTFKITETRVVDTLSSASVIKDAGDDPDVTNKAVISASAQLLPSGVKENKAPIIVKGGEGVGTVTKPGLPVAVGEPAINPVPLQMIKNAVMEAMESSGAAKSTTVEITIIVPAGRELAKKTLNKRLGIIGGISILGTTGIVKPVSADAWTATIATSMNVASASGLKQIILSTGRTSEKCVQNHLGFPDESLVMMGDYLEFALEESKKHQYTKIHMATMWAKLLKGAMKKPQTHVRHGALEIEDIIGFFSENGVDRSIIAHLKTSNTAREVLDRLIEQQALDVVKKISLMAKKHYTSLAAAEILIHLVHSSGTIICSA